MRQQGIFLKRAMLYFEDICNHFCAKRYIDDLTLTSIDKDWATSNIKYLLIVGN